MGTEYSFYYSLTYNKVIPFFFFVRNLFFVKKY